MLYSLPNSYENFRIAVEFQNKLPSSEWLNVKIIEEGEARKNHFSQSNLDEGEGALYSHERKQLPRCTVCKKNWPQSKRMLTQ